MDDYEGLKLDKQLCFPLYACAREVVRLYKPYLDPIGLTYTQYIVMLVLWERDPLSVKELGERLYLDSGTLTPLLKKLEAQGLLTRTRSAADERSVNISLTSLGEQLRERAVGIPRSMSGCLPLSEEEEEALSGLLKKILGAVR
jgi:DNA-binding MarR family transcriptional regulator